MRRTTKRTKGVVTSPYVVLLVVGFIIVVIATIFPPIKQTIIDIAQALGGM